jgi:intein-encoded DNA endonuclease-like protein
LTPKKIGFAHFGLHQSIDAIGQSIDGCKNQDFCFSKCDKSIFINPKRILKLHKHHQCFGKKKHMSISKHVHIGIWLAINSKNYASFRQIFQI